MNYIATHRFVPEGTAVVAPIYSIHRDPANFSPFPDEFRPDRWLHKNSKSSKPNSESTIDTSVNKWHTNTTGFMPFSIGPANCAGKNLAMGEMRAVVALLLQRFDITFAEGYDVSSYMEEMEDRFIMQVGELRVSLKVR